MPRVDDEMNSESNRYKRRRRVKGDAKLSVGVVSFN